MEPNVNISKSTLMEETRELEIGIRQKRKLVFFPLSVSDFWCMEDAIEEIIKFYFDDFLKGVEETKKNANDENHDAESLSLARNIAMGKKFIKIIKDNSAAIFSMTTGEDGNKLFEEMLPKHYKDAIQIIFDMNYASTTDAMGELLKIVTQAMKAKTGLDMTTSSLPA